MSQEVKVPDIGDFDQVDIIEVLVSPGDTVAVDDPLITLESDKASMEIPSPMGGTVQEVKVKVGDRVGEGDVILLMDEAGAGSGDGGGGDSVPAAEPAPAKEHTAEAAAAAPAGGGTEEVKVPDIGDFSEVDIIEVLVSPGDSVKQDDPLITLESDKASMEIPSPKSGTVQEVKVKVGDKVGEGSVILTLETGAADSGAPPPAQPAPAKSGKAGMPSAPSASQSEEPTDPPPEPRKPPVSEVPVDEPSFARVHASPSVRRFARELGADLGKVEGTGRKGRITKEDVQNFVKRILQGAPAAASAAAAPTGGAGIPPIPPQDFSKFGEVEEKPLSRIKRLTATNLHRSWLNVPHVTHHDEADITDTEAFRKSLKDEAEKAGVRVTLLAFLMKASVSALKAFPNFNASLSADGEKLILKKYYHLGIAVDTPDGLVVPVVRDVDKKSIFELSGELGGISKKARDKKLGPAEMQGACFTISSLGGIGGTAFTPIVNAPEVAILGVTRAQMKPVWNGKEFTPQLMQPLSLSFDHRVIDGAEAARFVKHLGTVLSDVRRLLL